MHDNGRPEPRGFNRQQPPSPHAPFLPAHAAHSKRAKRQAGAHTDGGTSREGGPNASCSVRLHQSYLGTDRAQDLTQLNACGSPHTNTQTTSGIDPSPGPGSMRGGRVIGRPIAHNHDAMQEARHTPRWQCKGRRGDGTVTARRRNISTGEAQRANDTH